MSHQSNASKIRYTEYTVHIQHWRSKVGTTSKNARHSKTKFWAMGDVLHAACARCRQIAPPCSTCLYAILRWQIAWLRLPSVIKSKNISKQFKTDKTVLENIKQIKSFGGQYTHRLHSTGRQGLSIIYSSKAVSNKQVTMHDTPASKFIDFNFKWKSWCFHMFSELGLSTFIRQNVVLCLAPWSQTTRKNLTWHGLVGEETSSRMEWVQGDIWKVHMIEYDWIMCI
jgi:hypothetical protein